MTVQSSWRAIVVGQDVTWFANHKTRIGRRTPAWAVESPHRVVHAMAEFYAGGREATVILRPDPKQAGKAESTRAVAWAKRFLGDAQGDGWSGSSTAVSGLVEFGWVTLTHQDFGPTRAVHVGILPWIDQARTQLFDVGGDSETIADRLAQYDRLTGVPWRGTAGLSGCAAIRQIHETKTRGGVPLWRWDRAPQDVAGCAWEIRGSDYQRPISKTERTMRQVTQLDTRAQYLGIASTARVGWSKLIHTGAGTFFDPQVAGYWVIRRDQLPEYADGMPVRWIVRAGDDPLVPVTTPVLGYLHELGVTPDVMDAWTAERTGQYLQPWALSLRDAMTVGAPGDVLPALKATYKRTVSMLARPGGRIYRPDWRDEVVDRARINLLRKVRKAGVCPLRFHTDAIWVAHDEPVEEIGHRLGSYNPQIRKWMTQNGKLKVEATMTPREYVKAYE